MVRTDTFSLHYNKAYQRYSINMGFYSHLRLTIRKRNLSGARLVGKREVWLGQPGISSQGSSAGTLRILRRSTLPSQLPSVSKLPPPHADQAMTALLTDHLLCARQKAQGCSCISSISLLTGSITTPSPF